jgi:hypothetical protein
VKYNNIFGLTFSVCLFIYRYILNIYQKKYMERDGVLCKGFAFNAKYKGSLSESKDFCSQAGIMTKLKECLFQ